MYSDASDSSGVTVLFAVNISLILGVLTFCQEPETDGR